MTQFHLAQINIAQAQGEMDASVMRGFVTRLDEINALADQAPGFVWRLQSETGDATALRAFDDPLLLINMSVWKSIEDLRNFVYRSMHVELIRDREAWFKKMPLMHQALFWIPAGKLPDVEQGKQRLEHLQKHGPTQRAFTFGQSFPAE